jgi:hypothetical protein
MVQGELKQKGSETLSQKTTQAWWFTSGIPATQEAEIGGWWFMANRRQKLKALSEK